MSGPRYSDIDRAIEELVRLVSDEDPDNTMYLDNMSIMLIA